jgi:Biotin carboxylase, N-terminal domain
MQFAFVGPARVLIANRGEIARRVIRTCTRLGVETVSIFTTVDALAPHVREATKAVCLGDNPREYTNAARLVQVRRLKHVDPRRAYLHTLHSNGFVRRLWPSSVCSSGGVWMFKRHKARACSLSEQLVNLRPGRLRTTMTCAQ